MESKLAEALSIEQQLAVFGPAVVWGGGLGVVALLVLLSVLTRRAAAQPDRARPSLADMLLTGPGMMLALLIGTILTVAVGVCLVAVYKYLGFNDDFGQGSGSLIQAIWGSAATISAAVVAILLALEAIRQARATNVFAQRSIELQEKSRELEDRLAVMQRQESPAFRQLECLDQARRDLDWYALSIKPLLARGNGQVLPESAEVFEFATRKLIAAMEMVCKAPIFVALSQWPLAPLPNQLRPGATYLAIAPSFSQTYGGLLNQNYLAGAQLIHRLDALEANEPLRISVLNSHGRMFWAYLYTLRTVLDYVSIDSMERFMAYRLDPSQPLPAPASLAPIANSCPEALDLLAQLGELMNKRQ